MGLLILNSSLRDHRATKRSSRIEALQQITNLDCRSVISLSRKHGNYSQIFRHYKNILQTQRRASLSLLEGITKLIPVKSWRRGKKPTHTMVATHELSHWTSLRWSPCYAKTFYSIPDCSLLSFPLKVQSFRPYWVGNLLPHFSY